MGLMQRTPFFFFFFSFVWSALFFYFSKQNFTIISPFFFFKVCSPLAHLSVSRRSFFTTHLWMLFFFYPSGNVLCEFIPFPLVFSRLYLFHLNVEGMRDQFVSLNSTYKFFLHRLCRKEAKKRKWRCSGKDTAEPWYRQVIRLRNKELRVANVFLLGKNVHYPDCFIALFSLQTVYVYVYIYTDNGIPAVVAYAIYGAFAIFLNLMFSLVLSSQPNFWFSFFFSFFFFVFAAHQCTYWLHIRSLSIISLSPFNVASFMVS